MTTMTTTTTQTPAPAAEKPAPAKKCCKLADVGHGNLCPNRDAYLEEWKPIVEADKGPRR